MRKPRNYDTTDVFGSYVPVPNGNYKMSIYKVEEKMSRKNKPMLIVWLDIAEGEHRGRFQKEYKNNTNPNADWGCKFYVSVEDANGNCHQALKTFINAVEKSNRHFDESRIWNDQFTDYFMDCFIGAGIRREEYINKNNENKWSSKVFQVFPMEEIETRPIPEDKHLAEDKPAMPSYLNNAGDGFNSRARSGFAEYDENGRLPWDE